MRAAERRRLTWSTGSFCHCQAAPVFGGGGLITTATGANAKTTAPNAVKFPVTPFTLVWQGQTLGTPDAGAPVFGVTYNNPGSSPYLAYCLTYAASSVLNAGYNANGTLENFPITTMPSGTHQCAISWEPYGATGPPDAFVDCFLDGKFIDSTEQNTSIVAYASTAQLCFGDGGSFSLNANSRHDFGLIYRKLDTYPESSRVLFSLEWLAAEPYAYILPPMSTRYVFMSSIKPAFPAALLPAM